MVCTIPRHEREVFQSASEIRDMLIATALTISGISHFVPNQSRSKDKGYVIQA